MVGVFLLPLAFLLYFFLYPVGAILGRGMQEAAFNTGLVQLFAKAHTWHILGQTIGLALGGTIFSVMLGVPLACILYCFDFAGKYFFRSIITIPFVLPTIVVGIAFKTLLEGPLNFLGFTNSALGILLAMVFFNLSVVVRTVGSMWQNLDPRMVQVARTLGASSARAFCTVTLPALLPSIIGAASLVFLYCATAYGLVVTLGGVSYGTLETEIYLQTVVYFDLSRAAVLSLLQFAIVYSALWLASRFTMRAETKWKLVNRPLVHLTSKHWQAWILLGLSAGLVIVPLFSLVLASLQVDGQWSLANYYRLTEAGFGVTGAVAPFTALQNSVRIALDATLVTLLVGLPTALWLARPLRSASGVGAQQFLQRLTQLPLGVSAVTVGFGFLLVFQGSVIGRSPLLVPLAQAVVALPLFLRALVPALRAIDPRLRESATVLGANAMRVLWTVDFPVLWRSLGLATGFAFAVSIGEFGATSFLANPDSPTLPVVIVQLLSRPGADNYGTALAAAVVLALIAAVIMSLAEFFTLRTQKRG